MAEKVELPKGVSKEEAEEFLNQQPVVFKTLEIGHNSQIRIHRTIYKNKELLSIQKFWRESEADDWQYGKAIVFKYEDIDEIIEGLTTMKSWCEEHPKGES